MASKRRTGCGIVLLLLILGAFVWVYAGCQPFDLDKHAAYDTYAEAEAAEMFRKGWLPDFMPRSATNIVESHNLDTNKRWLTFRVDPTDLPAVRAALEPAEPADITFHSGWETRLRPWWPRELLEDSPALRQDNDLYTHDFTIHHGGGPKTYTAYVAIEKDEPQVWYWDPRGL